MKNLLVIGIGAGDPDYLTLQAVKAIGRADAFFVLGKGEEKQDLVRLRQAMLASHARPGHRVVEVADPDRDRTSAAYTEAVEDWRSRRADLYEHFLREDLGEDETGAILAWGDPSLYDSTLAIVEEVRERGRVRFEYAVVPGISSVSALAAKHRTGLNRVGEPVRITTGRRLAGTLPELPDDVAVMLDARTAFAGVPDEEDVLIYWGAYVGTPDEILVSGLLREVAPRILELRAEARERKGWIMDTYLLRRVRTS
ncbi:precorrin-6A synthase (deacetylating) [Streptacidiphilus sp. PB12-B1b]|uniref:precorrin-6A synthase (deacetylating) n=1 Tax=Streptacidiphilus sp. PB12-B1b TaxID=2705012 RepID=UPI0015F88C03|nr:precorrin-6A synthase (deacetylating) [Streptacidiphilus sp. PB12-B1b]QMU76577.1 precorrin-6A synthase (deacetylating) [Streptacidiphilus sp. PB12-B1b]